MNLVKRLLMRGERHARGARAPKTYDLTQVDYAFRPENGGQKGHITCWSALYGKPREGDYLLLRNGGRSTRYRVVELDTCWNVDPPTMWMADLVFAPRAVAP